VTNLPAFFARMKTVELSDEIYGALEAQVRGFGDSPEAVIRRLLQKTEVYSRSDPARAVSSTLGTFVSTSEFKHQNGKGRYLALLSFLSRDAADRFEQLDGLRRGKRVQICRDAAQIEKSGKSTFPEQIPGSSFWALTNLSNRSKRDVIFSAFSKLGYGDDDIRVAVQSIPDSGLERSSLKYFSSAE
jgi:negative modulator of initiation of replication